MKAAFASISACALLVLPGAVLAQYTGPGARPLVRSVAAVAAASDDVAVEIDGHIIKQLTSGKFLFSDGKDQVRVEIDENVLPKTAINERTKVRIRGEVEKDFLESPEIDVISIEIIE